MDQYYLLGSPVAHSLSPAMMNYSFEQQGIDARYSVIDVKEDRIGEVVRKLRAEGASGWNVTMPVKHAMSLLCDELSTASEIGGSVNTVLHRDGKLYGYTTDGIGITDALARAGEPVPGSSVTLLGTGGAASAILIQAALDGASDITVFANRPASAAHAERIAEKLRPLSDTKIRIRSYKEPGALRESLAQSRILIQATSIGMRTAEQNGTDCLIPDASYLHAGLYVYDIIYHPAETPLIKMAKEAGCRCENGYSMLIGQGAASFRIWTGCGMNVEEVRRRVFPS